MCGRVACNLDSSALCEISKAKKMKNQGSYKTSYNISPTNYLPVVYNNKLHSYKQFIKIKTEFKDDDIELEALKWGSTNKDGIPLINIRTESLAYVDQYREMMLDLNFCVVSE